MKFRGNLRTLGAVLPFVFGVATSEAVEIKIDYTYDTGNFFDTSEKREAIESVARLIGDMLDDKLLAVDSSEFSSSSTWNVNLSHPSTGGVINFDDPVIPEDTIIIYVGARELGGSRVGLASSPGFGASGSTSWFNRIFGRGNPGAQSSEANLRTDVAPKLASVAFDTPRQWNFSLSQNQSGTEFVGVAIHEILHVLGIGQSGAWDNLLSGATFTGNAAQNSFGRAPDADSGHFTSGLQSRTFGSFSQAHGPLRSSIMLSSLLDNNVTFNTLTDLDLAALADIGWEVNPKPNLTLSGSATSTKTLQWPSVSFFDYRLKRSSDLLSYPGLGDLSVGNGTILSISDTSAPNDQAFYILESYRKFDQTAAAERFASQKGAQQPTFVSEEPRSTACEVECDCPDHAKE